MNGMFPHSFSYTHQSFQSNYVSSPLRPCFLKKKKQSLWFGWEGPVWQHSAAIQFPHPGMKTSDTLVLSKPAFVHPCCEQSRQKALRKSHQKQPSFFAPRPEELPLDNGAPRSFWRTYVSLFCGCIRTDLRRAGASETSPNRCNRLASALESVRKCGFHWVVLLYPGWITSRHIGGPRAAAAGTKAPSHHLD